MKSYLRDHVREKWRVVVDNAAANQREKQSLKKSRALSERP